MAHPPSPPSPETAATIACRNCGGGFRVRALAPVVPCPYCGYQQALSPADLASIAAYEQAVGRQVAEADDQARLRAAWSGWYDDDGKLKTGTGSFFAMLGVFAAVWGAVGAGGAALGLVEWAAIPGVAVMGGMTSAAVVTWVRAIARMGGNKEARAERAAAITVACPACGAPGKLTPGASVDTCAHCRAPLVPTTAIMEIGLDAARQARRRAAMATYRLERNAMSSLYSQGAATYTPYIIAGSFTLMVTVGAIGFTVDMLTGGGDARPAGLAIIWLIALALWGVIGSIYVFRKHRRDTTNAVLDHLVRQFSGLRFEGVRDTAAWLNRFWAGPYAITQFYVGSGYGAAALRVGGFACLLDYCPDGAQHMERRVQLLLAAWVPGASDGEGPAPITPEAAGWIAELDAQGWSVDLQVGGVVARAHGELEKRLRRPEGLHAVAPVLDRLARIAHASGCRPVDEIP